MKYKQVELRVSAIDKSYYFVEYDLPYDREDVGEYAFGVSANIYIDSDSSYWKKKLIEHSVKTYLEDIDKLENAVKKLQAMPT